MATSLIKSCLRNDHAFINRCQIYVYMFPRWFRGLDMDLSVLVSDHCVSVYFVEHTHLFRLASYQTNCDLEIGVMVTRI